MNNPNGYKEMAKGAKENMAQREAFEHWVNQGKGRTLVATRQKYGISSATIQKWRHFFNWDARLREMAKEGQEVTLFQKPTPQVETQEMIDLRVMIDRLKKMVDGCFHIDEEGNEVPNFIIVKLDGFTKVVKEYRDCVEAYARLQSPTVKGKKGEPEKNKIADTVNFIMGQMSQEERLELIQGRANKNIVVSGGVGASQPASEDADYTDVPDGGDADGRGCAGVPDSVAGAEGGDEGELRKGGACIAFPGTE
ncbi:MAG: hypothetical protein WC713_06735 [Candidatus Methylomirabilota bacterium]